MEESTLDINKKNKAVFIVVGIIVAIYIVISIYFTKHFFIGTKINSINVSCKTMEEAKKIITEESNNYILTIEGINNKKDKIFGKDIDVSYNIEGIIKEIKEKQNPAIWIVGIFTEDKFKVDEMVSFDENKLEEKINKMDIISGKDIEAPKSAELVYNDKKYDIVSEVKGNTINKESFIANIKEAILEGDKEINLEEKKCYEEPKFTEKCDAVKNTKETADKYVSTKVKYILDDETYDLDGDTIKDWISINEEFDIMLNEKKVKGYLDKIAKKYNTVGISRQFKTSNGNTITVSGGDYGRIVDTSQEVIKLIDTIKEGKSVTFEPEFAQAAMAMKGNDIGDTYVEVSLLNQYLWFYKNGNKITEGPIVTGNVARNFSTPAGVYKLKYKERNAVLKGEGYESKVSFWMPFNNGIGIHDATWRGSFGGQIYKTNGSHGCVNAQYDVARAIYQNIEPGTAVICY